MAAKKIIVRGAKEHNLQNINIDIPREKLVVITGLSGSGKSSLAFDTIYAEGQRRYVESLSSYARQFLGLMEKPDVEYIEGLSPAISIEQKGTSKNPRSTVGTVTEIYDYLRLLFARIGIPYCYNCGKRVEKQTVQQIVDAILHLPEGKRIHILSPIVRGRKGEYRESLKEIQKKGFVRVRIDGTVADLDKLPKLEKNKKHNIEIVVDRLVVKPEIKDRLTDSVETALHLSNGLIYIDVVGGEMQTFSEQFACVDCEISYEELTPRMFSFNSPYGACHHCHGLGTQMDIDPEMVIPDKSKSLAQGAMEPIGGQPRGNWFSSILKSVAAEYDFDFVTPWRELSEEAQEILLYGSGDREINVKYVHSNGKAKGEYQTKFEGVIPNLKRRYNQTGSAGIRQWIEKFMSIKACPICLGSKLKKESLAVRIGDLNIQDVTSMSIKDSYDFIRSLKLGKTDTEIANQIIGEVKGRLKFLINVGLDYLSLNRRSSTLSGGESQRIRLATQIGSQLMGVLYILDEPSIGLHQRDNLRLINALKKLRDMGNTVLVVEHDREIIEAADWVVDMGPGAGKNGGFVVAKGTPASLKRSAKSITGKYLSGKKKIVIPKKRRKHNGRVLHLKGASGHNLKKIDIMIPLGTFTAVTGVSGSGKSTLINETLYPALMREIYSTKAHPLSHTSIEGMKYVDKVVDIDQSPIGRTPRSNPATYTGTFTYIRDLFSNLPESKIAGYKPGRFSFNVKGGRCESCEGDGVIKIEMHFLSDVYVQCEVCEGKRYNRETLGIRYKGMNISDILEMTVSDALQFFDKIPRIKKRLQTLYDVGLSYIHLGQQATTLSGGEAQRVKLATELSKLDTGNTIYILDEPTTGLHFEDIKMLLKVLNRLVDLGNTVLIIEHNLDVIKVADYLIDLGPEGGDAGGMVVASGTPEEVAKVKGSYTGQFLKEVLNGRT
ncbi:excinuclease ABC subunit UvrA [Candidatus Marinimicrobia bacterium MT.SAG.3]|nr:excinuclease ABC subunit UvrA [Candidatus Marinimicrobia bacterium MT.SAG.3]